MLKRILQTVCVLAAAATVAPLSAGELKPIDIGGRWTGATFTQTSKGTLTVDIVACGKAWCGVQVAENGKCGGTALKLQYVKPSDAEEGHGLQFDGSLELAAGTEPYTVQAWLMPAREDAPIYLMVTGDTGGSFRVFRRSFPFEAQLARTQDAVCHAPQSVSSLR